MQGSVGKSAVQLTVARVLTLLITLVSAMLLSRFRSLFEYGTYSQLLIVIQLAISLFTMGLPNSTNFFLARAENKEQRVDFLSSFYGLCTILSVATAIVLFFGVPVFESFFENTTISDYAFFLVVFPWTQIIINSISNVLVVYGRIKRLFVITVVNAFVSVLAILVAQWMGLGFKEYLAIYLVGEVVVSVWIYLEIFLLERKWTFKINAELIKSIIAYSVPIGVATLVGTANIEVDKLVIGYFFDTDVLAIYTNAAKELPLYIFSTSLTAVIMPKMTKYFKDGNAEEAIALWKRAVKLGFYLTSYLTMICIVFAPQIIAVLYSEKYLPGSSIFQVYSLVLLFRTTYFGIVLNTTGKTRFVLYSSLLALMLNLGFSFVLCVLFGPIGPAWATVISMAVVAFAQLNYSTKIVGINVRHIFPWSDLMRISIFNAILGALIFAWTHFINLGVDVAGFAITVVAVGVSLGACALCFYRDAKKEWNELK
ncbi:oligosaccharide flippase family protein [Adlercreutzia sp. ZJ154]|uniref:oligosaccharide flippase family protein n=1 Tax=Adlercreutzia sp. ZJ154 TaxID=2709790 RepID=UPI0013EB55CF|nr:oligosaccharide flippase family protein [Adlercreutzia sp. ZJ154]